MRTGGGSMGGGASFGGGSEDSFELNPEVLLLGLVEPLSLCFHRCYGLSTN